MILAALSDAQQAGARLHAACQVIFCANDSALEAVSRRRRPPVWTATPSGQCAERA